MRKMTRAMALAMICLILAMPFSFAVSINPASVTEEPKVNICRIRWETDIASEGLVNIGRSKDMLGRTERDFNGENTVHQILVENLVEDTEYFYQIEAKKGSERDYSEIRQFRTLKPPVSFDKVKSLVVKDITYNSATISYLTTDATQSRVVYSTSEMQLTEEAEDATPKTDHEVKLTGLEADTEYYYKVMIDGSETDVQTFHTYLKGQLMDFIQLDSVPPATSNRTLKLSGTVKPNSKVYAFINNNNIAAGHMITQTDSFEFSISLVSGINNIEVKAWDQDGNKDIKNVKVRFDDRSPMLEVEPLPGLTSGQRLNIKGRTEPNITVEVFIDGQSQGGLAVNPEGYFSRNISIGGTGQTKRIMVLAYDSLGNNASYAKEIAIDREAPFIKEPFASKYGRGVTHFKLLTIRGKTSEPNVRITVTNFGKFTGCEDARIDTHYGGCDKFTHKSERLTGIIDPVTMALGMVQELKSDDEGDFKVTLSLVPSLDYQTSTNNIIFDLQDPAGNVGQTKIAIKYEPGCSDWMIGPIQSYPFNIYTRDIHASDIDGSAIFPVQYIGGDDVIKVQRVEIGTDDSLRGASTPQGSIGRIGSNELTYGIEDHSKYIDVGDPKASHYNTEDEEFFVYAPIIVRRYMGTLEQYPDQLYAPLAVRIHYVSDGDPFSCELYPQVSFDVQKPELVTKWLSPEMLNNTIEMLDETIDHLDDLIRYVRQAYQIVLISCGIKIAWDYLSGFSGDSGSYDDKGCRTDLEWTWWICDRVICPKVPPHCGFGQNDPEVQPETRTYTDPDTGKTHQEQVYNKWVGNDGTEIEYYDVNEAGEIEAMNNDPERTFYYEEEGLRRDLSRKKSRCKGGTLVVATYKQEATKDSVLVNGRESVSTEVTCYDRDQVKDLQTGDYKPPDGTVVRNCYSAECPNFDNTKCLFGDAAGKSPVGGIILSTQCGCLPGMYAHLSAIRDILMGAKKCLEQAQMGEVRGGFCERLLAQFVCDIMIEALKWVMGEFFETHGGTSGISGGVRGAGQNFNDNAKEVTEQLSQRYDGYIDQRLGLSTDRLLNKACVFAVTGDWSLIDGLIDNVLEQTEVEPYATILAESRPYGYDPFTGRMNIYYNIYVGIIPGGDTEVKTWLECDRDYEGGEFCGNDADPMIVNPATFQMTRYSPNFNRNIPIVDENAKYWYNKAVLELKYKIGKEWKVDRRTIRIWRKGDLAFGCTFSMLGGISCQGQRFGGIGMGTAELYPVGSGTRFTPQVSEYYAGNKVMALVKIANMMEDDFYVRLDYPGTTLTSEQFQIPAAGTGQSQDERTYLLLLQDVADESSLLRNVQYKPLENVRIKEEDIDDFRVVRMSGPNDLNKIYLRFFTNINSKEKNSPQTPNYIDIEINRKFIETGGKINLIEKFEEQYDALAERTDTHIEIDRIEVDFVDYQKSDITLNTGEPVVKKQPIGLTFEGLSNTNGQTKRDWQFTEVSTSDTPSSESISRTAKLTLLEDTDDDGYGDTPILQEMSEDQSIELKWRIKKEANDNVLPKADLIEPVGSYLLNPKNEDLGGTSLTKNPITFSFMDDNNEVYGFKVLMRSHPVEETTLYCNFRINGGRVELDDPGNYPGSPHYKKPVCQEILKPNSRTSINEKGKPNIVSLDLSLSEEDFPGLYQLGQLFDIRIAMIDETYSNRRDVTLAEMNGKDETGSGYSIGQTEPYTDQIADHIDNIKVLVGEKCIVKRTGNNLICYELIESNGLIKYIVNTGDLRPLQGEIKGPSQTYFCNNGKCAESGGDTTTGKGTVNEPIGRTYKMDSEGDNPITWEMVTVCLGSKCGTEGYNSLELTRTDILPAEEVIETGTLN